MSRIWQATSALIFAVIVGYYVGGRLSPRQFTDSEKLESEYDYIIVGGGSAGSVVAARLSEDEDRNVLLLEAGGHYDENPLLHIPLFWTSTFGTESDWAYVSEPQNDAFWGFYDNRMAWPRGRVLGGCGMVNALMWVRGSKYDFNEWANNGCTGWSYKDVLPYFLKSEDMHIDDLKASKYHSTGGPMAVSDSRATPLSDLYLQAGKELGYETVDYNGADQEGFGIMQGSVRQGIRSSSAVEFLGRAAERNNLHIALRSFVTKIKIEKKKATGVYVIRNGRKYLIKARKEIILSAGAFNSPKLLMLSGVGPESDLREHGIDVIADLPVGHNLQHHVMLNMYVGINSSYSVTANYAQSLFSLLNYKLFGKGPLSIGGGEGMAFIYTDESMRGKTYADIQLVFFSSFLHDLSFFNLRKDISKEYLAPTPNEEGLGVSIILTHPKSKGILKLKSSDPFDHPTLDPKILTNPNDVNTIIAALRVWENLMKTSTFEKLGTSINGSKMSFCSQHKFRSDAYWECHIRHLAMSMSHQSGTCKMGAENDHTAVVDPQLRVKGIEGLRVVDTSIFPNITSGNTYAPVIMVAEKASDMIRGIDSVKNFRNRP